MSELVDISIIIRTYNEAEHIRQCLEAIHSQKINKSFEVIVVDSGSEDETCNICKLYNAKIVCISKSEFTFGRALNYGINAAAGRVIVSISGHCIPRSKFWLNKLASPIFNKNTGLTFGSHEADPTARTSEYNYFKSVYSKTTRKGLIADHFNNGNSAFLKTLWKKSPFNESISAQEDVIFARTAYQNGDKIEYVPSARVIHCHKYNNSDLYNRFLKDYKVNLSKKINNQDSPLLLKSILVNFYTDIALSLRRKVFIRALPGVICFRTLQFIAYIMAYISEVNKKR